MVALGVAIVLVLVAVMGAAGVAANRPPLRDPPGVLARLAVYLTRNVAQTQPRPRFPELAPFVLAGEAEDALQRLGDAFRTLGWEEVAVDPQAGRVTAVVRSRLFRFRDDVEATLLSTSAQGVTVQVRSASRIGRGDLGANTRHVMDLREHLDAGPPRREAHGP